MDIGLRPKNIYARVSVHEHIKNGSFIDSPFISCSASWEAIVNFARRSDIRPARIAAICAAELEDYKDEDDIYDLTDSFVRNQYLRTRHADNRASKIQEVLIEGSIPPSCIQYIVDIECKYEYLYRLLRKNEEPLDEGMQPKNPDADYEVYKFIIDGKSISSQFISTCASLKAVKKYARNAKNATKRVAKVNVRVLMDSGEAGFIDLTERQNRDMYLGEDLADDAWRSARLNREVLIIGNIPEHCIEDVFIV